MARSFNNRKAQNTAEYAILIALVIGGVVAMQTYAQRALQGRLRDASVTLRDQTNLIGNTLQYEPYYSNSTTDTDKESSKTSTGNLENSTTTSYKNAVDRTEYRNVAAPSSNDQAGF